MPTVPRGTALQRTLCVAIAKKKGLCCVLLDSLLERQELADVIGHAQLPFPSEAVFVNSIQLEDP